MSGASSNRRSPGFAGAQMTKITIARPVRRVITPRPAYPAGTRALTPAVKMPSFSMFRSAPKATTATWAVPTRGLGVACGVLLPSACATGEAAVKPKSSGAASTKALIAEPAPADEIDYVFTMACTHSPTAQRRKVVVAGYVTADGSRDQRSGVSSIGIDGVALSAAEPGAINARFPPDAFQDHPWIVCENEAIRFTIPYRNSGKDGALRFVIGKDALADFDR